ncbi:MAG: hypothetical protein HYZ53_03315 [Planctomycetes bacterium]|nr:hypothetical protein [Planctomycetota bacterium]
MSPAYVVAQPLRGVDARYFALLFGTRVYMREVDKFSRGIVKDRNRLYWEDFKQMPSPCPPPSEQGLIADAIDLRTKALGLAADRVQQEIEVIREYRTRLFADVVTGKLDVREAAARLPEEREESEPLDEAEALAGDQEEAAEDLDDTPAEDEA